MAGIADTGGLPSKGFGDAKYSDLIVECRDCQFQVHRMVVCAQSTVMDEACVRKDTFYHIKLEDDPSMVDATLEYLYTKDYCDEGRVMGNGGYRDPLKLNLFIHTMSDKYKISGLGKLATEKFTARALKDWNTIAFVKAIEYLYTVESPGEGKLRDSVVMVAAKHAKKLFKHTAFRKVAEKVPKFAAELSIQILEGVEGDVTVVQSTEDSQGEARLRRCRNPSCGQLVDMTDMLWGFDRRGCCPHCGRDYFESEWQRLSVWERDRDLPGIRERSSSGSSWTEARRSRSPDFIH